MKPTVLLLSALFALPLALRAEDRPAPTPKVAAPAKASPTPARKHRGVSGKFRHVGGKLQKFFTGKNTIGK